MGRLALSPEKNKIRELFNQLAKSYAVQVGRRRAQARADVSWIEPRPGESALDLACGPGTLTLELGRHCRCAYGIDLAEGMIAAARRAARRQRRPNLHFLVGDGETLPFPAACFDLIVCGFSFAGFPAPEQVAREIARVSAPGARVAQLEVPAAESPSERGWLDWLEERRSGSPMRLLSLGELLALFPRVGFELADCHILRRRLALQDWLALSHPRARPGLEAELLRWLPSAGEALCGERRAGRWYLYPKVARLLWWKPGPVRTRPKCIAADDRGIRNTV